jgi:hypothetical protein
MRKDLERLFRDTTLAPLAFAIVLGWALFVLAVSIAGFITAALLLSLIVFALVLGLARVVRRRSGAPG